MRTNRGKINHLISSVKEDFWSTNIASEKTKKDIIFNMKCVKWFNFLYLLMAYSTCVFLLGYPIVSGNMQLPLPSIFPFPYDLFPYYEMLLLWHFFCNFSVIFIISGFDFLFHSLMMNAVAQFRILQDVLKHIYKGDPDLRERIYKELEIQDEATFTKETILLFKCVRHHMYIVK